MTRLDRVNHHRDAARRRWHAAVQRNDLWEAGKAIRWVNLWDTARSIEQVRAQVWG